MTTSQERYAAALMNTFGPPQLVLARGTDRFDAILFHHVDPLPRHIRAAYRPDVNEWDDEVFEMVLAVFEGATYADERDFVFSSVFTPSGVTPSSSSSGRTTTSTAPPRIPRGSSLRSARR